MTAALLKCQDAIELLENENMAMREAVQIAKDLAEWSARYPRGRIYSASNRQMDAELIELEERAKAAAAKLQSFLTEPKQHEQTKHQH